jgi:hypothetical protein
MLDKKNIHRLIKKNQLSLRHQINLDNQELIPIFQI